MDLMICLILTIVAAWILLRMPYGIALAALVGFGEVVAMSVLAWAVSSVLVTMAGGDKVWLAKRLPHIWGDFGAVTLFWCLVVALLIWSRKLSSGTADGCPSDEAEQRGRR